MDRLRMGIIGIGNMGSTHAKNIAAGKIPEMKLTAVADLKESRRQWAADELPSEVKIFTTGEELIKSHTCDAVVIATPHYQHPTLAIQAFDENLHVLCEKPSGVYTKQVREMNEAADKSDVTFAVMFNQRTNPLYKKMHEMVTGKKYGEIMRVNWIITDWFRTQIYYDSGEWRGTWSGEGGGVLLNQCPHQLDMIQWICGMPSSVRSFMKNGNWHDIEVEDDVTTYLEYPNGATGVFITSTGDAPGTNRFEVTMEGGKLVCENDKLTFYETAENVREFCRTATDGFQKPEVTKQEIELTGENPQHIGVMKAFAGHILHGTPLVAKGQEGINGLMLSNAMHLSAWLDQTVTLPIDEELFLRELNQRRKSSVKKVAKDITFNTEGSY